jgi:hypothetical protein
MTRNYSKKKIFSTLKEGILKMKTVAKNFKILLSSHRPRECQTLRPSRQTNSFRPGNREIRV